MLTANVYQIKTRFSEFLDYVLAGNKVVISKRNIPVAEISAIEKAVPKRLIGQSDKKFEVPQSFFKSLPKSVVSTFINPQ